MRMYQRRRQLSAEETAANADRKAAREAAAMTCQCCGRRYLANTGLIAHHAFQRPGDGWQTASCRGARYAPFEQSRDRLGDLVDHYRDQHIQLCMWREAVAIETNGFNLSYTNYDAPRDPQFGYPIISFSVKRETFDALVAEHTQKVRHRSTVAWHSFDEEKTKELESRDLTIEQVRNEWVHQTWRYATWEQTHSWDTRGVWVVI